METGERRKLMWEDQLRVVCTGGMGVDWIVRVMGGLGRSEFVEHHRGAFGGGEGQAGGRGLADQPVYEDLEEGLSLADVFGMRLHRQVVCIEGYSDGRGDEAGDTVYG
jgi:hypothetical protein